MKTLKYEEVLRNEYRDLAEAFASIPSSGKGLQPETPALGAWLSAPVEFEAQLATQRWRPLRGSLLREFSQAWGIYRSDVGRLSRELRWPPAPGAHRHR